MGSKKEKREKEKILALRLFNLLIELKELAGQYFWEEISKEEFILKFVRGTKTMSQIFEEF